MLLSKEKSIHNYKIFTEPHPEPVEIEWSRNDRAVNYF